MIETRRLSIRSFREEDWQAVHAYSTDPEVARYVPGDPPTEKDTLEAIRAWIHGRTADPPHFDFAVTVSPDDFVIGWCCIQISASDRRLGELMYAFNRSFWGKGYATEAARSIVNFGFSELKLHRIYATCRPENFASWKVLEKIGMHREGLLRENVWIRSGWQDSYLYAILEHEWKSRLNILS